MHFQQSTACKTSRFFDPQAQSGVHLGDTKRSQILFEFFMIQLWKVTLNLDLASCLCKPEDTMGELIKKLLKRPLVEKQGKNYILYGPSSLHMHSSSIAIVFAPAEQTLT